MLNNFDICINTRFIFGKGAEKQIGEILKKDGVKKVLIHHDNGQYLYDTGLLQAVCDQLTANGIAHAELEGFNKWAKAGLKVSCPIPVCLW